MRYLHRRATRFSFLLCGLGVTLPSLCRGATIVDHFNYGGDTSTRLTNVTLPAGGGWAGGWTSGDTRADYRPGSNLTYSAPGYSNGGDVSGLAGDGSGNIGHPSYRLFSTALSGTIWVTALAHRDSEVRLFLPTDTFTTSYVGLNLGNSRTQFGGNFQAGTDGTFSATTHLFLVRLQLGAGNDTMDFWVNPDLTGGPTGLGTPTSSQTGEFGSALNGVGVSFHQTSDRVDAIRVSNDLDGFYQVTLVPEPGVTLLCGLGSMVFLRRRRSS